MSSKWSKALSALALSFLVMGLASLVVQFMAGADSGLTPGGPLQNPSVEFRTGLLNADSLFLPGMFADIFEKGGHFADWYRPRSSFFFPDYPIFGLAYWLAPNLFGQVLLYALLQTLLVVAAVWLIAKAAVGTNTLAVTAVVSGALLWLALNAGQPFVYILASVFHYGAFLTSLFVAGLWLRLNDPARPMSRALLLVAMVLMFLGTVSNSMFIILCVVPLAATSVAEAILTRNFAWKRQLPLVCLLGAAVLGYVLDMWAAGPDGKTAAVVDPAKFGFNFLYSIGLFRNALAACPPLLALWVVYAGLVMFSLVKLVKKDAEHRGAHWLALFSFMSAACCLSVFTLVTYLWPPQSRYFTAAMTWPVIVVGIYAASYWRRIFVPLAAAGSAVAALSIVLSTYALAKDHQLGTHYYLPEIACIDNVLEETGLRNGIANYWDARAVQLPSRLDLNIAQYSRDLYPVHWITSKRYFKPPYDFAIISDYDPSDKIAVESLLRVNGKPEQIVACGVSSVYVYGKNRLHIAKFDAAGRDFRWGACELPSAIGEKTDACRVRKQDIAQSGPLSFGPYEALPAGRYAFEIHYASGASPAQTVADWDVMLPHATDPVRLQAGKMAGTDGKESVVRGAFTVDQKWNGRQVEVRTLAHAGVDLESIALRIERLP